MGPDLHRLFQLCPNIFIRFYAGASLVNSACSYHAAHQDFQFCTLEIRMLRGASMMTGIALRGHDSLILKRATMRPCSSLRIACSFLPILMLSIPRWLSSSLTIMCICIPLQIEGKKTTLVHPSVVFPQVPHSMT